MVKEIPLTRGKCALVDDEDYERVNQYKWHAINPQHNIWYAEHTYSKEYKISMHRFILSLTKKQVCDHINYNGLDNRRCNIRIVTHQQNHMNRRKTRGTSKYKGVHWDNNKWRSCIYINKKKEDLGRFINEEDAARAYDEAAKRLFGEYAKLNFISEGELDD